MCLLTWRTPKLQKGNRIQKMNLQLAKNLRKNHSLFLSTYSVRTECSCPFDAVTSTLFPLSGEIHAFSEQIMEEKLNLAANQSFSKTPSKEASLCTP